MIFQTPVIFLSPMITIKSPVIFLTPLNGMFFDDCKHRHRFQNPITARPNILIFKVAFSTFWFNTYDVKPSGAIAKRGTSYVT